MPARALTLLDLIAPALAADGISTGNAALDAVGQLPVLEWSLASDTTGTVIRGKAGLDDLELVYTPPLSLAVNARVGGNAASRPRSSWIDIRDTRVDFILHIPHLPTAMLDTAPGPMGALIAALDANLADAPPSLAPGSGFTLDLLLTAVVIRPPGLVPAKIDGGLMIPDAKFTEVRIGLPKVKLRIAMASSPDASGTIPLTLDLLSLGAEGLDDPGDVGVAELVTMTPEYALWGDSGVFGFGFRSATLDLSSGSTPGALLAKFGVDDGWRGLYLPEARLYLAVGGKTGLAFTGIITDMLLSFEGQVVLSADASVAVIEQGDGAVKIGARFVTSTRPNPYGITYDNADQTSATADLPSDASMVADISGGRPPYKVTIAVGNGAAEAVLTKLVPVPPAGTKVRIMASDSASPPLQRSLDITVRRVAANRVTTTVLLPGQKTPGGPVPDAVLTPKPGTSPGLSLRIRGQTPSKVTITLDPPSTLPTKWVSGGQTTTGPELTVDVAPGASIDVIASRTGAPEPVAAYWRFDRPPNAVPTILEAYQRNKLNAQTAQATGTDPDSPFPPPPESLPFVDAYGARLAALPAGTQVNVTGYASYEGDDTKAPYNLELSRRRAEGLAMQINAGHPALVVKADWLGHGPAKTSVEQPPLPRNAWWKVVVVLPPGPPLTAPGTLAREKPKAPGTTPPTPVSSTPPDAPTPGPPPPPPWFRKADVTVRIIRDQLIALELHARIHFQTALSQRLPAPPPGVAPAQINPQPVKPPPNTSDGLTDFRVIWQHDPATDTVTTRAFVGADPADTDGLFLVGWRPGDTPDTPDFWRNWLGFTTALLPLLSSQTAVNPPSGVLSDIADTAAVVAVPLLLAGLAEGPLGLQVERVVLYGIEAIWENRADGQQVAFLFDVETALSLEFPKGDAWLITIPRDRPLSVRYKAIGVRVGPKAGETGVRFHPMFDASKGYTIDASRPGQIKLRDGLDGIVKVLGARIARTNPLTFEVDIGSGVELGPVTISRARVRLPLDPIGQPELTALGVVLDIPGALRGRGELEIGKGGLGGSLDVTLVPIGLRIAAELTLEQVPKGDPAGLTSLFVGLRVEFPAPIPLWTSGLGIYGFLGAFAMNQARRDFGGTGAQAALNWLNNPEVDGDPSKRAGWEGKAGAWGFGLGAVLGSLEGGFLFNLRGALILELPGPNLLLTMKARLLAPRPGTLPGGDQVPAIEALAVIDIDLAAGTLSIGLLVTYDIKWLLTIKVPVEAFFDTNESANWHVYVGQAKPESARVQARVISAFDGSGYLMLAGHSLDVPNFQPVPGFNVAAGVHVNFVWGSVAARLYARVGGGFDALLGFDPVSLQAKLTLEGELRLFIVSIGAHASLDLAIAKVGTEVSARLSGEICGRVEFFFFDVEGCVDFGMGEGALPKWEAPALVADFAVMSRSPALAVGSGISRPIDAKVPLTAVPIDSIPVLTLRAPPATPYPQVFGKDILGPAGGFYDGTVEMGGHKLRYVLTKVELVGPVDGNPNGDDQPSVWWLRDPPSATKGTMQLALLTWTPTPAAKAIEYGERLTEQVRHRWGEACGKAAPPVSVMWTFLRHPIGTAPGGWRLWDGIAWPDPKDTVRSSPPDIELRVDEAWRGSVPVPGGVEPAAVEIRALACPPLAPKQRTHWLPSFAESDRVLQARLEVESKLALAAANGFGAASVGVKVDGALGKTFTKAQAAAFERKPKKRLNCYARMLGSPMYDEGQHSGFGTPTLPSVIAKLLGKEDEVEAQPASPWWNVLRVHCGPCSEARLLLSVRADVWRAKNLVVVALAEDGSVIDELETLTLTNAAMLPPSWHNFGGPWQRPIAFLLGFEPGIAYVQVMCTGKGLEKASRIEIGVRPNEAGRDAIAGRPFYLGAIEAMRVGEVARAAWDTEQIVQDSSVVASALGLDSNKHALLVRDTEYEVKVEWTVSVDGGDPVVVTPVAPCTFRTDNSPPASLRPWLLTSHPAEGEAHVFGGEKVALVFATDDVARLWKGYGHTLRARLRAASYRQPEGASGHPWPLEGRLSDVPGSVVSPWEQAIGEAIDSGALGCVQLNGEGARNTELVIPVALDPFTDYTIIVEAFDGVPPPPNSPPPVPPPPVVLSIGFTTSAHATAADFARSFSASSLAHVHIASPDALVDFAAATPSGVAHGTSFDEALANAGLGAVMPRGIEQATILWSTPASGPPQPVAVLLDAPEAIWRSRPVPRPLPDPESNTTRTVMTPVTWLRPVELVADLNVAPQPQKVAASRLVSAMISSPGGQRGLFLLTPGARGQTLVLGLRHVQLALGPPNGGTDPCPESPWLPPSADGPPHEWLLMVAASLARAPWEDDEP